jgi:hypothetical protein
MAALCGNTLLQAKKRIMKEATQETKAKKV